ncbi:helix-turn-helix domain-containing protein [Kitasatospora sp. CM 4170]|uniref:TetR/AcrR family transcriptional regulator n=1 Tax=Kitasatospora aburaviensis TaxID=67265 RepID=A0ABW1ET11_9ACTN|nr:helix-turn-helix domain-containing protein [Kitasatospora sp. CM 4170]WNM45184.1 helix-turn-helix domain-containing protein [Kitasatospora sp. CM 4170]
MAQQPRRGRPSTGVREAVLRATEEVLGEAGPALSTKEIARRAGVAESSIFYHFGDRLGLLQAVIGLHLPLFADATAVLGEDPDAEPGGRAADGAEGDPVADLAALLTRLERFYRRIMPILGALQADAQLRELLAARDGAIGPHLALGAVADAVRARQATGRLPSALDPSATALLLVGAAHQRALHTHLLGDAAARFLPPAGAVARTLLPASG